jgi:hypothetical protein
VPLLARLQSSLGSKPYFREDHFSGISSATLQSVYCIGSASAELGLILDITVADAAAVFPLL